METNGNTENSRFTSKKKYYIDKFPLDGYIKMNKITFSPVEDKTLLKFRLYLYDNIQANTTE